MSPFQEAPRSPLLKPGSGPELGDTQSQLQSMLARIPNMRVENSAQTMCVARLYSLSLFVSFLIIFLLLRARCFYF